MGCDRNIWGRIVDCGIIVVLFLVLAAGILIFLISITAVEFVRRFCNPFAIGVRSKIMMLLTQMAGIIQRFFTCVRVSLKKIVLLLNSNPGTVLTLIALGATLYQFRIVSNQLREQTKQVREQFNQQTESTKKQIAAEQFKNAIDHLGSKEQAVVLGGVHALHHLAMNFPEQYSQSVFEVLCSFIREETRKPEYQENVLAEIASSDKKEYPSDEKPDAKPTVSMNPPKQATSLIVIQTIVDKLFRDKNPDESVYRDHKTKQYYRADLTGGFLQKVNLSNANLQRADLREANMQWVDLSEANLQGAKLVGANMQGAKLNAAILQGADLGRANLQGASLQFAHLQGAGLNAANLQGAWLLNANLQGDKLVGADFRGIHSDWGYREIIEKAVKNNTDLKPDLSKITLYDDDGSELDLDEDGKKAWFIEKSRRDDVVDDLPAKEVQELFEDFNWW